MMVRKFTRDEWQLGFALAFMLHPSADVALHVLIDASWIATLLEQTEARRQRSAAHYKSPIPRAALLQFAVFCASLRWERDQESPLPKMQPKYKPTRDDLVVRYLKHLVFNNLLKEKFSYLAIALGCLHYDYKPKQITDFLGLFDEPKIRHIKSRIKKQLMKRFVYADVLTPKGNAIRTKPASDHERELLKNALKLFTPWNTTHITVKQGELLLSKMFADNSKLTNWDRKHLLLDPVCGGLERLINEHNELFGKGLRLPDPKLKLFVPDFDDTPTPPVDRFKAPRLTDGEITLLNERHKRPGPRAYNVNDLLSDLYECGVDESLIELLDDSASSTTESPPFRVLSHDSYGKGNNIRILFLAAGGGAMEKRAIETTGAYSINDNQRRIEWELGTRVEDELVRALGAAVQAHLRLVGRIYWSKYKNASCDDIDVRITFESLLWHILGGEIKGREGVLSWLPGIVVYSISRSHYSVTKHTPTGWDFIKRSISEDLIRHGTIRYPFTNIYWVDDHKSIPKVRNLLELWTFRKSRERGDSYEVHELHDVNRGCHQQTQSPIRLMPLADGRLVVIAFHWMEQEQEQEQCIDLKPFVPKKELLVSDWYDGASARRLQNGYLPCSFRSRNATRVKKIDARHSKAGPWDESSFPIWGIQMSANRASPETSTDAR